MTNTRRSGVTAAMRALAHRDLRLSFIGQTISVLGSWIQQVALAWLDYRMTGSAARLGVATFCALIPQLLVGPFAGAWIDLQDKKSAFLLYKLSSPCKRLRWPPWFGTDGSRSHSSLRCHFFLAY